MRAASPAAPPRLTSRIYIAEIRCNANHKPEFLTACLQLRAAAGRGGDGGWTHGREFRRTQRAQVPQPRKHKLERRIVDETASDNAQLEKERIAAGQRIQRNAGRPGARQIKRVEA
jgi:hypothetical protein